MDASRMAYLLFGEGVKRVEALEGIGWELTKERPEISPEARNCRNEH